MSTQTATPARITDEVKESKQSDNSVADNAKNNLALEANSPDHITKNLAHYEQNPQAQANRFLPNVSIDKSSNLYGSGSSGKNGADQLPIGKGDKNPSCQMPGDGNIPKLPINAGDKSADATQKDFSAGQKMDARGEIDNGVNRKASTGKDTNEIDKSQIANNTEKKLESMNKSISEGDSDAERETDDIAKAIGRDGSLGPGGEGKANEAALEKAMNSGELDAYVARINEKLEKAGSPYRVSAEQYRERMNYKQDVGNKAIVPQNHQQDNPRAKINVTNTQTGRTYQQAHLKNDPSRPGYYPPTPAEDFLGK